MWKGVFEQIRLEHRQCNARVHETMVRYLRTIEPLLLFSHLSVSSCENTHVRLLLKQKRLSDIKAWAIFLTRPHSLLLNTYRNVVTTDFVSIAICLADYILQWGGPRAQQ